LDFDWFFESIDALASSFPRFVHCCSFKGYE
jgi:hypothetical protein